MISYGADRRFRDLDEVMEKLQAVADKTFREIDITGRSTWNGAENAKGLLGQIIEESVLGYAVNSDAAPDIQVGDQFYELKVTPLKRLSKKVKNKVSAKERLVMDIINYNELPEEEFDSSTFWTKARQLIVVYYLDDRKDIHTQSKLDCRILGAYVFEYMPEDLSVIENDWKIIQKIVSSGHADQLSESDTDYLAASTKGRTAASSSRSAPAPPESDQKSIQAKQRAFSYKASFMSAAARRLLGSDGTLDRLNLRPGQSIDEFVRRKMGGAVNHTVGDLARKYGLEINGSNKSFNQALMFCILGTDKHRPEDIEQFVAANITQVKTTVLYKDMIPEQHMSFPALTSNDWEELAMDDVQWTETSLYRFFEENKFFFAVFQGQGRRRSDCDREDDVLLGGFIWNMPEQDINEYVFPVWKKLHDILRKGESVCYYNGRGHNRLPGADYNQVFHMRPHARDGSDKLLLPNGDSIPKQSWWLDRRYIAQVVKENLNLS